MALSAADEPVPRAYIAELFGKHLAFGETQSNLPTTVRWTLTIVPGNLSFASVPAAMSRGRT
jgi:hypothetical protein